MKGWLVSVLILMLALLRAAVGAGDGDAELELSEPAAATALPPPVGTAQDWKNPEEVGLAESLTRLSRSIHALTEAVVGSRSFARRRDQRTLQAGGLERPSATPVRPMRDMRSAAAS
ncbi:unnamed protein product, partial [Symbiodinium sp. KB8]